MINRKNVAKPGMRAAALAYTTAVGYTTALAAGTLAAGTLLALSSVAHAADPVGDVTRGKAAFAVCSGCHGAGGEGNEGIKAPRLAGQFDWYIVTQLKNFKSGARGSASGDSAGAMMQPMAVGLSEQAMHDVAAYINTLK